MIAPLAHELIVDNPKQIAIVKLEEYWFDDNRWEIYLPDGRYRLCLATRGIDDDRFGFPVVVKTTSLTSGRHHLALEQKLDKDTWRITARLGRGEAVGGGGAKGLEHPLWLVGRSPLFAERAIIFGETGYSDSTPFHAGGQQGPGDHTERTDRRA